MPGYVIHLAIAEEYLKKHKEKSENYDDFIEGVIFPDGVEDKSLTHFGPGSSEVNLKSFLENKNIDSSFDRGYFLHLISDYLFYNKYIDKISFDIYNDYDLLNKDLIEKYNVVLPEKAKEKVKFKENENLVILSKELVERFIDETSELDIDKTAQDIINNPEKWTKIRKLKRI